MEDNNNILDSLAELVQEMDLTNELGNTIVPFCSGCCSRSGGGINKA